MKASHGAGIALGLAVWLGHTTAQAQNGDRDGHDNMSPVVPEHLIPPAPVLSVQEALNTFTLAEGFTIEPVAAEPLVDRPVAFDTDPEGNLWVVEMKGYMMDIDGLGDKTPHGQIVVLSDRDKDGTLDTRTVFLENLLLPRAVAVFGDGVLFTDDTELRFVKREDFKPVGEPEIAVPGFVEAGNVEHKSNALVFGLDNWLYNAKSNKRLRRIDGKWTMEETAYRGQWGIARDDYGRLYHNNNSTFLFGDFLAPSLLQGNPGVNLKTNEFNQLGSNRCFPARVTPGVNRAYIAKQNGYDQNTLDPQTHKLIDTTAAAGFAIYRGTNFPEEWRGRGLVAESSVNFVKAIDIVESDDRLTGSHVYPDREWLASTDERFRPVNLFNAPDGSIYLVDFAHGIIQDKFFLTSYLRKQYLERGLDKPATGTGRIYRIRATDRPLEQAIDLGGESTASLVRFLGHQNGWHRDMAQRVLIERADPASAAMLEEAVARGDGELARIHALWTLEGIGKLTGSAVAATLDAEQPKVRVSGLWASTRLDPQERSAISETLLAFQPADLEQTIYLARALGPLGSPEAFAKLDEILASDGSKRFVSEAVFSGLDRHELAFAAATTAELGENLVEWLHKGAEAGGAVVVPGGHLKAADKQSFDRGHKLYRGIAACFGCHGALGEGVTNLGPPLDASEWVTGPPDILIRVLLHGLTGPITVADKEYATAADMPGLGPNPTIDDGDIADIATYVRNEWENRASPVPEAEVTRIRKDSEGREGRPYTAADLFNQKPGK